MTLGIPEIMGNNENLILLLSLPVFATLIHTCVLFWLPESPKHLLLTCLNEEAADKAIMFFHGSKVNLEEVKRECRELEEA